MGIDTGLNTKSAQTCDDGKPTFTS